MFGDQRKQRMSTGGASSSPGGPVGAPSALTQDGPKSRPEQEFPRAESSRVSLNSLTHAMQRPDALQLRTVDCSCGRQLSVDTDWYTEIFDGTLLCWQCSVCAKCGLECCVANRRIVSIGGHVLCYDCIKRYGDSRNKEWRPQMVAHPHKRLNRKMRKMAAAADAASQAMADSHSSYAFSGGSIIGGRHNTGSYYTNWWETDRSPECRRLIRYRNYPRPDKTHESAIDPKHTIQGYYDATPVMYDRMACPACKSQALGPSCCVVPAISMVYHRRCFRCISCKWPLGVGCRAAGKQFVFCSCNPPLQWCQRDACQAERRSHHVAYKCQMEPLHPGGREQRDTMECAAKLGAVQARSAKKKKGDDDDDDMLGDDDNDDDDAKTATSAASQMHRQEQRQQQQQQQQLQPQPPQQQQKQQKQQQPPPPPPPQSPVKGGGGKQKLPIAASAAGKPRRSARSGIWNQQQVPQLQPLQPQHGITGGGGGGQRAK